MNFPFIKVHDYILKFPNALNDVDISLVLEKMHQPATSGGDIIEAAVTKFHALCKLLIAEKYMELEMAEVPWGYDDQFYHIELSNTEWVSNQLQLLNNAATAHYLVTGSMILDDVVATIDFDMPKTSVEISKGDFLVYPANYSFRFTPSFDNTKACRVSHGNYATMSRKGVTK